ncbi:MAG TPA: aldose 1-epimerase family protein [Gaiellaceae bacterium]|nr:aldose 1-epimerase family protein [Gaiellaceae bacterium]
MSAGTALAPSGEQFELVAGDQRLVVVEVGAGLRTYAAGDRELLDGYARDAMCASGRGQLLLPWPNRIEDGTYEFDGRTHRLPLTEPSAHNAIHGLVRWAAWTATEREAHRIVMRHRLNPQPGYPFALDLAVAYELSDRGLGVRTTATNVGAAAAPYGCGAHPYLRLGSDGVDPLVLHVPARAVAISNARGLPERTEAVDGTELDFREPRAIGATVLDNAFTELERDADGVARARVEDPRSGDSVALWVDETYSYLMVFTGDPLPDVARRSLAIEPMTCPPNAFRSGESLFRLDPGKSVTTAWGIDPF